MLKGLLLTSTLAIAALGCLGTPAFATDARQAIHLCDMRPGCTYEVAVDGWVTIYVDGHGIICPPGEDPNDACYVAWRKATASLFGTAAVTGLGNNANEGGNGSGGNTGGSGGTGGGSGGGTGSFIGAPPHITGLAATTKIGTGNRHPLQ